MSAYNAVVLREAGAGDSGFIFDVHRQAFREYVELGGGWDDGHEYGALKATYYMAQRQDPRVAGLICASPGVRAGQPDAALMAKAERMVAEGHGQELLSGEWTSDYLSSISAEAYMSRMRGNVDVYGLYTPDAAVARVRVPLYIFFGTNEPLIGNADDLENVKRNATSSPCVDTALFIGSDHHYTGHEVEVATAISEWVDRIMIVE